LTIWLTTKQIVEQIMADLVNVYGNHSLEGKILRILLHQALGGGSRNATGVVTSLAVLSDGAEVLTGIQLIYPSIEPDSMGKARRSL
jgi:hypothetical protein